MAPLYRQDLIPAVPLEEMFTLYLETFPQLLTIAAGGIYPYTGLGNLGITRETTPLAFDADGYVLPLIVVKNRAPLPDNRVFDIVERVLAMNQVLELWVYQNIGYDIIYEIQDFCFSALHGHVFPDFWPMQWIYTTPYLKDPGSIKGASLVRQDFICKKLRRAVAV